VTSAGSAAGRPILGSIATPGIRGLAACGIACIPTAVALANGGYFASSWGWASLALAWMAALSLAFATALSRLSRVALAGFGALAAWSLLSSAWAASASDAVLSAERTSVVALGVLAFLTIVTRSSLHLVVATLVVGASLLCAYSLSTRLLSDEFGGVVDSTGGFRLSRPIGYWNGLGIFAVIALAIALGVLPHATRLLRVILAVPLPILAVTAYFTYSRGAAIAFGIALVVIFVLDPLRMEWFLRSLLVGAIAAVGVLAASQSPALTTAGASSHKIASEGHRLALLLLLLCIGSAAAAIVPRRAFVLPRRLERQATLLVSVLVVVVVVIGLVQIGGPKGVWEKFASPPTATTQNLNQRLFSFSGNYRTPLWKQALKEFDSHPILGGGAGSYETYYLQHRTRADKVKNAHNLYLETLAELGPVGLALLLVALLSLLAAVWRVRRQAVVPALAAAYIAFLIHMTVDWDWQLTGVALAGLFCGAGILVAASPDTEQPISERTRRILLGATVAAVIAAFVVLVGNLSLSRATTAARAGNWTASAHDAERARTWAPWSSEPYRLLGEAQLGQGATKAAAATLRRGIAKSPKDWNLWFDLARTTLGATQRDALAHAAKLNPLSPEIRELRSELAQEKQITVGPPSS
jgi:O-Antigen ligase